MSRPLSLRLYRAATRLAEPMAPGLLRRRAGRGKEDIARLGERLGIPSRARPEGQLVWLHGASVGESLSLLPFIHRLRSDRPDLAILITSGTRASADLLLKRLPPAVTHQYLPVDGPQAVRRFLDHWRPQLGVLAEGELWPNLILAAHKRGVRMALISARITEGSAEGWTRAKAAARTLLAAFDLILPQDPASAGRIQVLGGRTGPLLNLKFASEALPYDPAELARLKKQVGKRKVVLAASTHPGEDEFILGAFATLPPIKPAPLLVIAPRHPDRAEAILASLEGITTARRSDGEAIDADTQVYVADTLGEMGLLYRLADVAVMGGGFVRGVGGHNPLEPARLGVPVITGEETFNFADVYGQMLPQGAAIMASSEPDLSAKIHLLLTEPARAKALAAAGRAFAEAQGAQCENAMASLTTLLPPR
jgi:3-deoxy-D-manno-octulosonic-acid transferase